MIQHHSVRVAAGLWFVQYITEKFVRAAAWEAGLLETNYDLLFGEDRVATIAREDGVHNALKAIREDRTLLEILGIPTTMLRPTVLRELYKLQADDLICADFEKVCMEIRDIWALGRLKHLYIDEEFGDNGTRVWRAAEIMKVFARSMATFIQHWDDIEPGVDEAYIEYMDIWSEGFDRPSVIKKAIRAAGLHPIEPGYAAASKDITIPYMGIYAAYRCLDGMVFSTWQSTTSTENLRRHERNEKVCTADTFPFALAVVGRGFPLRLPNTDRPGTKLIDQIPGSYSLQEQGLVYMLAELVSRAIFWRFSAASAKRAVGFHGFLLDKDWEDYGWTVDQAKWNSLVTLICWGEEIYQNGVGNPCYDRPAYLVRELYKIVKEEMHCAGIIE